MVSPVNEKNKILIAGSQSGTPAPVAVSLDANGNVKIGIPSSTAIYSGKKTVASAGTAEVLAGSQAIKRIVIKALSTNSGLVYVGPSGVSSANGFQLTAGEDVPIVIDNLSAIYVDVASNGEGVTYIAS